MKPEDAHVFAGHEVTIAPFALYTSDHNCILNFFLRGGRFHARFMHVLNCTPRHIQLATIKGAIFRAVDTTNHDELLVRSLIMLALEFCILGYTRKFIKCAFGHVVAKYPYLRPHTSKILNMLS